MKKIFILSILLVSMSFFASFLENKDKTQQVTKKKPVTRHSRFYNGLPVKTIRSESIVNGKETSFNFPDVLQGDIIEHEFIIKNNSGINIVFASMKSCCGIILKSSPESILAGESGKVSVIIFTDQSGGKTINGKITGITNTPEFPEINISGSVNVKKFADISVYKIILKGSCKDELKGSSVITPASPEYPFKIQGIKAKKGLHINYYLEEISENNLKKYKITAENTMRKKGKYRDILFLQTDNERRPELKIRVEGTISD